jgi:hypothetical protein
MGKSYESIAVISDMHIPYNHPDLIPFLCRVKEKYKPDKWVCIGDEVDSHALSFHDHDPDLPNAGYELIKSRLVLRDIFQLIPSCDVLDSNHGSMVYRKAYAHGIPMAYIKNYNEILKAPVGWKWSDELILEMSDGNKVYFHHGKMANTLLASKGESMSFVQGHFHSQFNIQYWGCKQGLYFALTVGCLIDPKSMAFNYGKNFSKRPIIGMAVIVNGQPILIPMVLDRNGAWVGRL